MTPMGLVEASAVWRRVHIRLLPPLFMVSLLCQLDRANLAFAALQMDADLGFSRTLHGAGSGLFFIGYLAQIPANMICVAMGPTRWLPTLLACWGVVAMCFAAVRGTASFLVLRLLLGVAEAGAYPAIMFLLSLFYPPRSLGLAYTCVATATAVAGLLGAPLAASLMLMDGVGGLRGWMWLFLVEGMLPILLAAALPFLLPSSPLTAKFLTAAEQQWLWREVHGGQDIELAMRAGPAAFVVSKEADPIALDSLEEPESPGPPHTQQHDAGQGSLAAGRPGAGAEHASLLQQQDTLDGVGEARASQQLQAHEQADEGGRSAEARQWSSGLSREALRAGLLDARVWHLAGAMLLIDMCMNSCNFWIPSLVKAALLGEFDADDIVEGDEHSSSRSSTSLIIKSALLSALPFCGAAIAMVANAHLAKKADERRLHTVVPMLAAAVGLAAMPLGASMGPASALLALTLATSGIWATHGPFFSWPSAFLDHKSAAIGFALVKTGGAIGGFAGPFLVGALADELDGFAWPMLLLAGVAIAAAALVFVFNDRR